MFDRIFKKMRDKVRTNEYIMTLHAEEEMDRCILNGTISERNKDSETGEWKYTVIGKSLSNQKIGIISKISITGKLIIITVYKH